MKNFEKIATIGLGVCVAGALLVLGAAQPNYERNSWSTNVAGTPVLGASNLSVSNNNGGISWKFFYGDTNAIARLADILSASNSLFSISTLVSNGLVTLVITTSNSLSGSAGFAALELQTNSVRLGLVTNLNWTYGVTGSMSGATAILGLDDSAVNTIVSNGAVAFTVAISNALWGFGQAAGSNLVVVLSGTNTLVSQTSTNGTNFYAVNSTVSGDAGGTNARQFGTLSLTNLSGNPNVATNILGAGTVTVTSNNLGAWTITGGAAGDPGGTNARQFGTLTLTNISGTGAITNLVNASTNLAAGLVGLLGPTNNGDARVKTISAGNNITLTDDATNIVVASTASGGGGGFVSGITNIGYSTTNVFVDLGQTNYAVWVVTNTSGPVNLLFTNLTLGFNFTVFIDGENIDGGTTASNMGVTYVWPAASSLLAQWLGFQTNTWVTSNRVLGISGLIRRTNSVIISSRE